MRKVFTLFFVALFSLSMWADVPTYYYVGDGNGWDEKSAPAMTQSNDGLYAYYEASIAAQGNYNCKVLTTLGSWDGALGNTYTSAGFNGTDITNMNSASDDWKTGDMRIWFDAAPATTGNKFYILVYYANTRINPTDAPKLCASTTLPDNSDKKFYIIGDAAIMGAWNEANAVLSTTDSYTFENLAAGIYQLDVLPTGRWADNITRRYDQLTDKTDAGLTSAGNDHNICFRLTSAANVTVTYTGTVFTVTTDGEFFHLANGYYLQKAGQEVHELYSTPFVEHKSGEWKLSTSLTEGDQIKVVTVESNAIVYKFPNNDNFYTVDSDHDGSVNIYFTNNYKGDWATFGGYIYVEQDKGTALDNTVDGKKAVKRIVDGQLVIEREGKRFNALGAEVK